MNLDELVQINKSYSGPNLLQTWFKKKKSHYAVARILKDYTVRLFTLNLETMKLYYTKKLSYELKEMTFISFKIITELKKNENFKKHPPKTPFGLILCTKEKDYYLFTETQEQMDLWISAFSNIVNIKTGHPLYKKKDIEKKENKENNEINKNKECKSPLLPNNRPDSFTVVHPQEIKKEEEEKIEINLTASTKTFQTTIIITNTLIPSQHNNKNINNNSSNEEISKKEEINHQISKKKEEIKEIKIIEKEKIINNHENKKIEKTEEVKETKIDSLTKINKQESDIEIIKPINRPKLDENFEKLENLKKIDSFPKTTESKIQKTSSLQPQTFKRVSKNYRNPRLTDLDIYNKTADLFYENNHNSYSSSTVNKTRDIFNNKNIDINREVGKQEKKYDFFNEKNENSYIQKKEDNTENEKTEYKKKLSTNEIKPFGFFNDKNINENKIINEELKDIMSSENIFSKNKTSNSNLDQQIIKKDEIFTNSFQKKSITIETSSDLDDWNSVKNQNNNKLEEKNTQDDWSDVGAKNKKNTQDDWSDIGAKHIISEENDKKNSISSFSSKFKYVENNPQIKQKSTEKINYDDWDDDM